MLKKGSIMTRKNPFSTKVLYRIIKFFIIHSLRFLQHFEVVIKLFILIMLIFGGEKLKWHSSCDID